MRVLVCGGRDYEDRETVYAALDQLVTEHGALTVIEGGARGADQLAREWCDERKQAWVTEQARWKELGNSAGPIRNSKMLRDHRPELVLAFPGATNGLRKGTGDMVRKAIMAKVETRIYEDGRWRIEK